MYWKINLVKARFFENPFFRNQFPNTVFSAIYSRGGMGHNSIPHELSTKLETECVGAP